MALFMNINDKAKKKSDKLTCNNNKVFLFYRNAMSGI